MHPNSPLDSAHYRWRRFRSRVFSWTAVLVIGLAVLVGLGRLLVPYADELRPLIESRLSAAVNGEVTIEEIKADWPGFLPSVTVKGLTVTAPEREPLFLELAVLEVHWTNLFRSNDVVANMALVGSELKLTQDVDGQWAWAIQSLVPPSDPNPSDPNEASSGDIQSLKSSRSEEIPSWLGISLRDASLQVEPWGQSPLSIRVTEADFSRQGDQYRLSGWLAASLDGREEVRFKVWMRQRQGQWVEGRAWLKAEELTLDDGLMGSGVLAGVSSEGTISGEAWLNWDKNQGAVLDTELSIQGDSGIVSTTIKATRRPNEAQGRSWAIEIREMNLNRRSVMQGVAWARTEYAQAMAVEFIDLGLLHRALGPWFRGLENWPTVLSGTIQQVALGADLDYRFHHAAGEVRSFGIELNKPSLEVSGLDLDFGLSGDQLTLTFDGAPTFQWTDVIDSDVVANAFSGRATISRQTIELNALRLETSNLSTQIDGAVYLRANKKPFLDLLIQAPRIESVDVRPYLPRRIIPAPAMAWLDRALVFMGRADGQALLHFPLGLKTADFKPGHFWAEVNFEGLELDYQATWPMANQVAGQAVFLGQGFSAKVDQAEVAGLNLRASRVDIQRFSDPVIDLDLVGENIGANELSHALGDLPIANWDSVFGPLEWRGSLDAHVNLKYPVRDRSRWSIEGAVGFQGNDLTIQNTPVSLSALMGDISISRQGINSDGLRATVQDQVVRLDAQVDWAEGAKLRVDTSIDLGKWVRAQKGTEWLQARVNGQSDVSISLYRDIETKALAVEVMSSLAGVTIGLPAPITKQAEDSWPTRIRLLKTQQGDQWYAEIEDRWALSWMPALGGWSAAMRFGLGDPPRATQESMGLVWDGEVQELDVGAWRNVLDESLSTWAPNQGSVVDWADQTFGGRISGQVAVGALNVPGVAVAPAQLEMSWSEAQWVMSVDGASIRGEVLIPTQQASGRAVVVDLEHLYLLADDPELEAEPVEPPTLTDPRNVTPLTLLVRSLYWGDLVLGMARLETHNTNEGWEVELLDIDGPDLRLQARGRWVVVDGVPASQMQGRLSSRNFNRLIRATGYQAGLQASQATVDFDLGWPGNLLDFSLIRLNGSIDFVLRSGTIPQASPGAGRLLGLVSFSALPRRLTLDFRDVFASGLTFDAVEGRFAMAEGQATAERVVIASPVARINLTGTTDMIARSYNQSLVIEPVLGSTLPVIGGLAGGPVGAAAGLLLQSILGQPLKGVSQARYAITGPWSDPLIELVDAKVVRESGENNPDAAGPESPLPPKQDPKPEDQEPPPKSSSSG